MIRVTLSQTWFSVTRVQAASCRCLFPFANEDNPAFLSYNSGANTVLYSESVYVGYRFYEKTKTQVAFPFGHGLSYTTFELYNLVINESGDQMTISVQVHNAGQVAGSQVVQAYIMPCSPSVQRPFKGLKGFTKVFLEPGQKSDAEIFLLKKYATSFWDEGREAWCSEMGKYQLLVGDSSTNTPLQTTFVVSRSSYWNGV